MNFFMQLCAYVSLCVLGERGRRGSLLNTPIC